jgi:hypothetical protein
MAELTAPTAEQNGGQAAPPGAQRSLQSRAAGA